MEQQLPARMSLDVTGVSFTRHQLSAWKSGVINCLGFWAKRWSTDLIDIVQRFVPMDETWVHHYIPETKQPLKQWVQTRGSEPKKEKSIASAKKDNAPAHISVLAMGKPRDLRHDLLGHPPYSPDLALSDFHHLDNSDFVSKEEIDRAVDEYSLPDSHFWEGLILEKHWTKCVEVKGDYHFLTTDDGYPQLKLIGFPLLPRLPQVLVSRPIIFFRASYLADDLALWAVYRFYPVHHFLNCPPAVPLRKQFA
ncbi:hypothetical protein LAZ67_21000223 [Cordylochernes scorpioides]|uniref:Uncharacterized protein n=1 Tax=Cordylochernes scorpioides TaxID=51811 RepID=A0ABY6LLK5_9ARAC|nr:hypothetical protein LAZ67_21000223 [Cordylochernes scorpioides]